MAHPRDNYEFTQFFEVRGIFQGKDRHVEFFTNEELAERYIKEWKEVWTSEVLWSDIYVIPVYAVNHFNKLNPES